MMGGMWPTSVTMKAYTDSKAEGPKTLSDANALFAKAASLSATLAKYNRFLQPMLEILLQRETDPLKTQMIRRRLASPYAPVSSEEARAIAARN